MTTGQEHSASTPADRVGDGMALELKDRPMRYEITPRFTVGEDVSLALHADHPEDGRPQLLRVAWIVVEIQARATLISYFLRLRGLRAWSHEQEFLIGEKTRAGYVLCAEEELVPWAEAEAAYKTQQGDGTPERTP